MLRRLVAYEKINYLMLMMVDRDVHFHVIPRYAGERVHEGVSFPDAGGPPFPISARRWTLALKAPQSWRTGCAGNGHKLEHNNRHHRAGGRTRLALIDRYVLRMTAWPMLGCLGVTVISLLLERTLRLLDALSNSNSRFGSVAELAANLLPHYLGLALPVAFFVALFIVITRLDDGAEVEAFLASGIPLTRMAAPYVGLGLVLILGAWS